MNDEEIRMECLRLALGKTQSMTDTVRLAESFYAFVSGRDPLTIRQRVDAALDAANVK